MSLSGLLVRSGAVLRPAWTTTAHNDRKADWAHATSTTVRCWVSQQSSREIRDGRAAEIRQWVGFFEAGTDIVAGDRVVVDGSTFEVDGPPHRAWSPRGEHHVEAILVAVEG